MSEKHAPVELADRIEYISSSYVHFPHTMMGPHLVSREIPSKQARFTVCASYYDVAGRRYLRERWGVETSIQALRESPEGSDSTYLYPEEIEWMVSGRPVAC